MDATTPASSTPAYVARFPPELWQLVLEGVPARDLQRTTLSLLLAFPHAAVSLRLLHRHLVVGRPQQLWPLYKHLAGFHATDESDQRPSSRSFEMRSWTGDADMVVNVLSALPELSAILLNVGTNYSPDHLEDAFLHPRLDLRKLILRFRPYVDRASYHQFLAGAFYDSCLEALARWPAATSPDQALRHVSIVQDIAPRHLVDSSAPAPAVDPADAERRKEEERVKGKGKYTGHGPFPYLDERLQKAQPKLFAQPIVFFNTQCFTDFAGSPVAAHITHFRLRVPLRDVVTSLVAAPNALPSLRFLDLSTTNLRMHTHLPSLLHAFPALRQLVLDWTNLFGFLGADGDKGHECARELGKLAAMGGLARGKEREREIARWEEAAWRGRTARRLEAAREEAASAPGHAQTSSSQRAVEEAASALAQLTTEEYDPRRRRQVRSMATSTFSIRTNGTSHGQNGGVSSHRSTQSLEPYHPESIAFVLPAPPALESICLGGEAPLTPAQRARWQAEFKAGWTDGVGKLVEWAVKGVGERFERARRKAETDRVELDKWLARHQAAMASGAQDQQQADTPPPPASSAVKGKGKARASAPSSPSPSSKPLPPPRILLYRFPTPDEAPQAVPNTPSPSAGLIEVDPSSFWRRTYTNLLVDDAGCTLCLVPDTPEGPLRRGGNGEVAASADGDDGEGGSAKHVPGCGHLVGREVWDDLG